MNESELIFANNVHPMATPDVRDGAHQKKKKIFA